MSTTKIFRTGVPSDPNCFVILPNGFHPDANCLPPLQNHEEPLLERPVQEIKVPTYLNYLIGNKKWTL